MSKRRLEGLLELAFIRYKLVSLTRKKRRRWKRPILAPDNNRPAAKSQNEKEEGIDYRCSSGLGRAGCKVTPIIASLMGSIAHTHHHHHQSSRSASSQGPSVASCQANTILDDAETKSFLLLSHFDSNILHRMIPAVSATASFFLLFLPI